MNEDRGHDSSQKNDGLGLMDGVACVLSVACLVGSAISWWSWPLNLRTEGYPLAAPLFWSAFNIGLILVASALTLPSAMLIWKKRTTLRCSFVVIGLISVSTGVIVMMKWLSVPTLGHGP